MGNVGEMPQEIKWAVHRNLDVSYCKGEGNITPDKQSSQNCSPKPGVNRDKGQVSDNRIVCDRIHSPRSVVKQQGSFYKNLYKDICKDIYNCLRMEDHKGSGTRSCNSQLNHRNHSDLQLMHIQ